jgi:EAL domain-containing protein (putative c-di-GMP-specific phosphodiesterase class I)
MINSSDLGLLDGFERALINHRLHMVYQPKVSLTDGSLVRVEALVRWEDPKLGAVPPSRFVPLAEHYGLIGELTQWGLTTTLRQWLDWRAKGIDTCIAFNISALSLEQLDFPDLVERMCRALGVPTDRLVLELTEGATQSLINLMDTLTRFRIKGIGLAMDDFGVGYSTLMQLRQLPFTEIKIDRFFIDDLVTSKDSHAIVASVIQLGHSLDLSVTAEGIETEAQLQLLCGLGCDVGQGYWIGHPLEPAALGQWQKDWRKRWAALTRAKTPVKRRSRSSPPQETAPSPG